MFLDLFIGVIKMNEKEIIELTNRAVEIYNILLNQGACFDWSTEKEINEAIGRLTYSESEAIESIKNFIEDHKEDIE